MYPISAEPPVEISITSSIEELAQAALAAGLLAYRRAEVDALQDENAESVHDLRVATRRMRTALTMFGTFLPRTMTALRDDLDRLGSTIGALRDLDVQLAQLQGWAAGSGDSGADPLGPVLASFRLDRERANIVLIATLEDPATHGLLSRLSSGLERGPLHASASGSAPIAIRLAPGLIEDRYRAVLKAARRIDACSPDERYHTVRKRARVLRYSVAFIAPLYGRPARELIRRLTGLQDILGGLHDAEVGEGRLRIMAEEDGDRLAATTLFAMGEAAHHYSTCAAEFRRRYPKGMHRVRGKPWADLRRAMERRAR